MKVTVYASRVPAHFRMLAIAASVSQGHEKHHHPTYECEGESVCDHEDCSRQIDFTLPSHKEVCGDCEGHGTVLNPSMRFHAYTAEDLQEWDDQDREEYFKRGGIYDVTCPTCNGQNVVDCVDRSKIRKGTLEHVVMKAWDDAQRDERQYRAICEAEARFCA